MTTTREMFASCRCAVERLDDIRAELLVGVDAPRHAPGVHASGVPDPTAHDAAYRVDVLARRVAELHVEQDTLLEQIGEAGAVIAGVRAVLGEPYGYVLESYYVDCWCWERVAGESMRECGVSMSVSTAKRRRDVACDWVDAVGVVRAREGRGFA